eukprot:TRINITY_DN61893_c0_g1_i1.p1 TRINITY_DN61893_c0_g1~~TRINITY_DN61893_c0_g1_i1.p1  ORF type:complete len:415 (-),score=62.92 TRINITY_DN61893_c0_g1_i1:47-1291(-)
MSSTVVEATAELGQSVSTHPHRTKILEEVRLDLLLGYEDDEGWHGAAWHRPSLAEVRAQCEDPGTIRIFLNGCFDLMHVGHFNALRQAKRSFYQQGYVRVILIAGIHSDAAILNQKGPPLTTERERFVTVRASKWVDEIVSGLPYVSMSVKLADTLQAQFVCHGDDLPLVKSGGGMYTEVIESNRFHLLKRTEGVSTTTIIERLLRITIRDGEQDDDCNESGQLLATVDRLTLFAEPSDPHCRRGSIRDAKRVVYVDGAFDLLHAGHISLLEHAASLGDFLLVGLHSDAAVMAARGSAPVLNLHERALAVLSQRYVDDVILGAPRRITQDLLTTMNISTVVSGRVRMTGDDFADRYDLARAKKIFVEHDSGSTLTHRTIFERVSGHLTALKTRNEVLWTKEVKYIGAKGYVAEQ